MGRNPTFNNNPNPNSLEVRQNEQTIKEPEKTHQTDISKLSDEEQIKLAIIQSLVEAKQTEQLKRNINGFRTEGFQNIGNTCYFNALMQLLFSNESIRNILLEIDLFSKMFRDRTRENIKAVRDTYLSKEFNDGKQHDSTDAFNSIMDILKDKHNEQYNKLLKVFSYTNKQVLYCPNCFDNSSNIENVILLNRWAFDNISRVDSKCGKCNNTTRMVNDLSEELGKVVFVRNLTLTSNIPNEISDVRGDYQLAGHIIHDGEKSSGGSGHYYTEAKDVKTNKYYKFNDSNMQEIDNLSTGGDSYLLMYVRK